MAKRIRFILLAAAILLVSGGLLAYYINANQTTPIDSQSPTADEVEAVIWQLNLLEVDLTCTPGTQVDVLAQVLVDSPDYHASDFDRDTIEKMYGRQALEHAGLLTAKQAYYLWRMTPSTETPPTGIPTAKPTAPPSGYCPAGWRTKFGQTFVIKSVAQAKDGRVIVNYEYGYAGWEVTLRSINGQWMITSQRVTRQNRG